MPSRKRPKRKLVLRIKPLQLWGALLGIWGVILTGILSDFTETPGVIQAVQLSEMLEHKRVDLEKTEAKIHALQVRRDRLKFNRSVQEQEIRKVLGYTKKNEIVF